MDVEHSQVVSKSVFSGSGRDSHGVMGSGFNMRSNMGFSVGSSIHFGVIFGFSTGLQEIHKIISFVSGSSKSFKCHIFDFFLSGGGHFINEFFKRRVESRLFEEGVPFIETQSSVVIGVVSVELSLSPEISSEGFEGEDFNISIIHPLDLLVTDGGGKGSTVDSSEDVFLSNLTIIEGKGEFGEIVEQVSNSDEIFEGDSRNITSGLSALNKVNKSENFITILFSQ